MNKFLKNLRNDSRGETMADYAMVVLIVILGSIIFMPGVAPQLYEIFQLVFGRSIVPNMTNSRLALLQIASGALGLALVVVIIMRVRANKEPAQE